MPTFWFMHARGLQPNRGAVGRSWSRYFDSCMREDCNEHVGRRKQLCSSYFDSCMREDCNLPVPRRGRASAVFLIHACARIATGETRHTNQFLILIHACARIATSTGWVEDLHYHNFDSCMREDCNSLCRAEAVFRCYFNSCMCEDCNPKSLGFSQWVSRFDSCMREDCNDRAV